ncbi:MAG: exopolysaccharide biosynthesis polyprenyl glycosylphosphotransferase [Opitutaceae bacterium]|nr:exopolysaccharide biosynthesis polyprenyl glycosylphosphotransferase [Opitutaceae bacterium]
MDIFSTLIVFNLLAWARGLTISGSLILAPLLLPAFLLCLGIYLIDGYEPRTDMTSVAYVSQHGIALITGLGLTLLLTYAIIPGGYSLQSSRIVISLSFLSLIPITLGYRGLLQGRRAVRNRQRYFLFAGSPESCRSFKAECTRNGMSQGVLYATIEEPSGESLPAATASIPPSAGLLDLLRLHAGQIDAIILRETSHELPPEISQKLVDLHFSGVPTYTLELFHEVYWRKIPLYRVNQTWLFQEGFPIAREPVFARLKRLSDILFAVVGLVAFAPLYPFIAAAIWLNDRGPILFRQTRVGKNRVPFELIKFRTMRADADAYPYTRANDDRVTAVGRWLRTTRLDEVPQLWNVLVGEMSLIGPRAEWTRLVEEYEINIPCYHFRHLIKPGITGWAQVNYPYGAGIEDTLRKLEYDLYYIRYFSFVLDASIVLKTVQIMLFGKGR